MSKRPPAQTKFSFEEGEAKVEIPEIEPIFKVGDKVRFKPEYTLSKGIYWIDSILYEWGEPLYIVSKVKGKSFLSTFCCTEMIMKVG